ncbi:TetR/AcrR family transcriptional regulator [Halomonas sp. McH1-25]|uniref:TetR/AcrR family transcriptional regulator n=1 Tax=unclassified Halomonas TaxID=2609666 RepID=UPI001EF54140|nr:MULTISPECIES: TetR/AcrR family transcriptional regulator [unclassified Halomonas]MCG7601575.1 TetR/AcrR family transcriptional regulator [Halomonas sp. McH1-25]MCP1343154.1 TetR/AcrR family transcriptional regulator [Halomonas sp. FL8]MCP1360965.1 TetR/AcrR family transcriptional regulator [Halomonas sp. BBD45]MCP1364080.1 TetR/AcrR family transcriptional regulator [Halomonas sp. BBD48]
MSKRDDILSTALKLFNEHGYHAVGVDRIRDEAKVSKMTLYNHFSNKEKLVEEVLKLRHDLFKYSLESSVASFDKPYDKLKEIFNWHARWFFSQDFHGCMFIKATGEFHDTNEFLSVSREHKLWVAELLRQVLSDLHVPSPQVTSGLLQIVLDGLIVNASIFNSFESVNSVWLEVCKAHGFPQSSLDEPKDSSFSIMDNI